MPIKFNFRNQRLVLEPVVYMFEEFTDILSWDRSEDKDKAHAIFYFIFLMCDLSEENVLRDEDPKLKQGKAMKYAFGSKKNKFTKREYELVAAGLECYIKYNNSAEERVLFTFDKKTEELLSELDEAVPETIKFFTKKGERFATNAKIINDGMKEVANLKNLKTAVIAAIKREAMSNRVRGAVTLTPLSKGNVMLPSFAGYKRQAQEQLNINEANEYIQAKQGKTDS